MSENNIIKSDNNESSSTTNTTESQTSQPPLPTPTKKKIVLKRAAGSNPSDLAPCRIKTTIVDSDKDQESGDNDNNFKSLCTEQLATIESCKYLTDPIGSDESLQIKRVIEITVDFGNDDIHYQPGDYISIYSPNPIHIVQSIINRLSLQGDQKIKIDPIDPQKYELPNHLIKGNGQKIFSIFKDLLDITGIPSKKLFRLLSEYCSNAEEKAKTLKLCLPEGRDEYNQLISQRVGLLELLNMFPSSYPPLSYLLDILSPLAPRDYSLSSSPLHLAPGKAAFVFSVVEVKMPNGTKLMGHCTSWLESLCLKSGLLKSLILEDQLNNLSLSTIDESPRFPFQFKSSPHFHLPPLESISSQPIIMIGPGTGIAPFIGFLQHLKAIKSETTPLPQTVWLFFGCRSEKRDFIYRDTLESMTNDNILTKLTTAFSRELSSTNNNDQSIDVACGYVQEKMKIHAKELFQLVHNEKAMVYICGDAKGMAVGVRNSFISILMQELGIQEKEATTIFTDWIKEKRYLLDVWS
eukprot:gene3985-4986_t